LIGNPEQAKEVMNRLQSPDNLITIRQATEKLVKKLQNTTNAAN